MKAIVLEADWDPRPSYRPTPAEEASRKAERASDAWRNPRLLHREAPDPSPAPGQVVVKVGACGVCGSDTHCIETDSAGYLRFSGPARLPVIPGHEYAGEVVGVGAGVRGLRPGTLVAAEGMLHCGVCESCRTGQPNQCPHLEMVGFSSPGAFAEYVAVEERFCWSLDGLAEALGDRRSALELGALVEPISCSYNGMIVAAGGTRPGDHVAVHGCGPIGLGAVMLARACGAATITAFDVSPQRCRLALALGADAAWNPAELEASGDSPADRVLEATGGWGADMQVECAGAATRTMPEIERAFAPGGRMVYLGRTGERVPVMLDTLVSRAGGIVGSRGHAGMGCFPRIIRLLRHGRIDPTPMITARMPFAEVLAAIERSRLRRDGKIMICY